MKGFTSSVRIIVDELGTRHHPHMASGACIGTIFPLYGATWQSVRLLTRLTSPQIPGKPLVLLL